MAPGLALTTLAADCRLQQAHPLLACPVVKPFAPWDASRPSPAPSATRKTPDEPFAALIGFYQRNMRSPKLPGEGCRLRPTCSVYGRQSLERWRALGVLLLADRLLVREHAFMVGSYLPSCAVDADGDSGLYDPVP